MVELTEQFDNGNNPYYLHQSDNPGMVLVTQPLANDNYNSWRRSMQMALFVKNKLGFVDGTISLPVLSDRVNAWTRANNLVISWLLNFVSKDIAASLIYHSTIADIWKDLEDRFQQNNGPRIFQLKKKLCELSQGSISVSTYYTQLKIVWDELVSVKSTCSCSQCLCGGVRKMLADQQKELVMQFLMGLNESFAHIRGQILLMDPVPSITKVFSLIVEEKNQRSIAMNNSIVPEAAFVVKASHSSKKYRPQCNYCGLLGHTKDKCYKLHGYPLGYKTRNAVVSHNNVVANVILHDDQSVKASHESLSETLTSHQCQQLIAMLTSQLQTSVSTSYVPSTSVNFTMQGNILSYINSLGSFHAYASWIIDSRASRHVCYSKELFESLVPIEGGTILLSNQSVVHVSFSGTVRLSSSLVLKNVLFVPQFRFNLISVSSLIADSNFRILFCKSECLIQDLHCVIGKGEMCQGLYLLQLPAN
ncbi:hypothetical protein GQ457_01G015460 [Hibiscus cannabinus]